MFRCGLPSPAAFRHPVTGAHSEAVPRSAPGRRSEHVCRIAGSLHFTPGQCYDEAPNGNQSAIHWDLVLIQRSDYGGGEIHFDGKLIRKDGVFTDKKMEDAFSKENLKPQGLE